jgi:DNA-directed RNA polymerase subunit F
LKTDEDEKLAAERNQMTRDMEETLKKFTKDKKEELEEKDRQHREAIDHHRSLLEEMEAKSNAEIKSKLSFIEEMTRNHQADIVSITKAKNDDIANEKALHEQTQQGLGGQISQLTQELSIAKARIPVCLSLIPRLIE